MRSSNTNRCLCFSGLRRTNLNVADEREAGITIDTDHSLGNVFPDSSHDSERQRRSFDAMPLQPHSLRVESAALGFQDSRNYVRRLSPARNLCVSQNRMQRADPTNPGCWPSDDYLLKYGFDAPHTST